MQRTGGRQTFLLISLYVDPACNWYGSEQKDTISGRFHIASELLT